MSHDPADDTYRILDANGVRTWLARLPHVRSRLGGSADDWGVREVGDGNLNLVFLVDGAEGSVCVKQALPYVRAAGPSWPMTPARAHFENAYYRTVAPYVGRRIPEVYHYEPTHYSIVMENLAPHTLLRYGLIAGNRYERVGRDLGEYIARVAFFTSDLAAPFERKFDDIARFAANKALVRISVDLIFTDPYRESPRNRHTTPQLDPWVAALRRNAQVKAAAARLGQKFLGDTQALIHGDLHSGSIMVTAEDTRVIDPEFAFYGPVGFDLGAFVGNLLLSWCAQPGHAAQGDDRAGLRKWILDQIGAFWSAFQHEFLRLWRNEAHGDAWPAALFPGPDDATALQSAQKAYLDSLFTDMLGFAACKMIRRIVGFAHVADLERISNAHLRASCERSALAIAVELLTRTATFHTIEDVLETLPRIAQLAAGGEI
ncbi:MAG: S-methyl-5-thioribose kinase [Steroidobacteraceae bacterium]|nr:S-methyl-5-thioribose kinase [Steroidobacteraceae bacterium]